MPVPIVLIIQARSSRNTSSFGSAPPHTLGYERSSRSFLVVLVESHQLDLSFRALAKYPH